MESIVIRIQSVEDANKGIPLVEGITRGNVIESKKLTVGILEAGTVSGATSLMFVIELPDGKFAVAECTANQFEGVLGAFKGALQRFGK